ncbi:MAG TPA: SGNH hydrolase domain-containing protein [Solirubrobacteraceae bacterium]|nr:SGNH hydrolase domain-containing protein [Solirubrobacteraceae bacterium]
MTGSGRFLRLFSWALVALLVGPGSAGAAVDREPKPHADAADAAESPLDIRSFAMGQRGIELVLRITTASDWETSQLSWPEGRTLCVKLFYGAQPTPRSRLCFFDRGGEDGPGLTLTRLDPFGNMVSNTIVEANVRRTDARSVQAIFAPSVAYLSLGRYSWQAESNWSCADVAACRDLAPNLGNVIARIKPLAEPRCFGAASRNPRYRCINRDLRRAVVPTPEVAALSPNARCTIVSQRVPYTCRFGVRPGIADRTIALIGDSHATHWRGALEVVAQARRWQGYSITRAGCPLSTATPDLSKARRSACAQWRRGVFAWLARHPEVNTVFVSQLAGLDVRAPRGVSSRDYEIRGFIRAWRRLPKTVRRVIVLRDTPVNSENGPDCVMRALRRGRPPGPACALRRSRALPSDPAAVAARRAGTRRVRVLDMTRFMCSPRLCFPVVGGVLVHKDNTHITNVFATTLGPFVLRRIDGLLASRRR